MEAENRKISAFARIQVRGGDNLKQDGAKWLDLE